MTSANVSPSDDSAMVSRRPSRISSRLVQIGAQSNVYCMPPTRSRRRSRPSFDRHRRLGVEPLAVERRVLPRGPQILDHRVDLVAQLGIVLPDAYAERLDAEHIADDLVLRVFFHEALQYVEAAGQGIDATLHQREPRGVVVAERDHFCTGGGSGDV